MPLTSTHNPLLLKLRRAVESGRPMEDGVIAAEGPHLLSEALHSGWQVQQIYCSDENREPHREVFEKALRKGISITEVSARAFKSVSATEQNQGVLCLVRPRTFEWQDLFKESGPVVILDGIQDPGNAGAIIRSVEAFCGAGVVLTEGCVRISNGKLLRAAAGSLFRVPYLENRTRTEVLHELRKAGRPLFALTATGQHSLFEMSLQTGFALAVGSEGRGVSPALLNESETLSIPTKGVESLNAAIACSIALFEAARQLGS